MKELNDHTSQVFRWIHFCKIMKTNDKEILCHHIKIVWLVLNYMHNHVHYTFLYNIKLFTIKTLIDMKFKSFATYKNK